MTVSKGSGLRSELPRALIAPAWIAGLLIVLVGFSGSLPLILAAASAAQLSSEQLSSWVFAVTVGSGLLTLGLSLHYRQPLIFAWSTPGLAVLALTLPKFPLEQAVGVYLVVGLCIALIGWSGLFTRIMALIPQNVALAVLGGILLKFGLGLFGSFALEPVLVGAALLAYFVARGFNNRVPVAWALLAGFLAAALSGRLALSNLTLEFARPMFYAPVFSVGSLLELGVPLFALALASQNAPGIAVITSSGYHAPVRGALVSSGLLSALTAPLLGHGLTLAAITAAIGMGPEAHPDKGLRYGAGVASGVIYTVLGLFGGTLVALFQALPKALISGLAGLALLGTIQNCLTGAFADPKRRDSSVWALIVSASSAELFGLSGAFWGLFVGAGIHFLLERRKL
jgi:benzoate membrane transport protein